MQDNSPKDLIARFRAGDPRTFEQLVIPLEANLKRQLRRYVSEAEAEELSQDVLLKAWRARATFRGDSAFSTWLYRIAENTAKNYIKTQRVARACVHSDDDSLFDEMPDLDSPEGLLVAKQWAVTYSHDLEGLPFEIREAFLLRVDGMSYDKIAETQHVPVGTAKSRVFRAREALGA